MTTIAACSIKGLMACDSTWSDGVQRGLARKVYRRQGALIGLAGDLSSIRTWLDAHRADALEAFFAELAEVEALCLDAHGLKHWSTVNGGWMEIREKRWAIGTGAGFALGAMDAGATVQRAVQIAVKRDAGSAGRVRIYQLRR
jgi:ATP-dependent protease HslVU (ClpYQ) peptidase subunit